MRAHRDVHAVGADPNAAEEAEGPAVRLVESGEGGDVGDLGVFVVEKDAIGLLLLHGSILENPSFHPRKPPNSREMKGANVVRVGLRKSILASETQQ